MSEGKVNGEQNRCLHATLAKQLGCNAGKGHYFETTLEEFYQGCSMAIAAKHLQLWLWMKLTIGTKTVGIIKYYYTYLRLRITAMVIDCR